MKLVFRISEDGSEVAQYIGCTIQTFHAGALLLYYFMVL
jgi:hypothetical protein